MSPGAPSAQMVVNEMNSYEGPITVGPFVIEGTLSGSRS
jgi:hypothetical protein